MQFNAGAFDSFLAGIGQRVTWRRSYSCACTSPTSGAADPKHALCSGKGRLWEAPIETVTGVAKQDTVAEWMQSGLYENGDMVLSIPQASPLYDAGQFDRVMMLNSTDVFSQPMTRGAVNERMLFVPASITRCFWLNPADKNQIVEGGIPVVSDTGHLSWPNGGEPPPAMVYSLTGTKYDEYFVFAQLPSDRNQHSGMRLPKRVIARRWDLFGR